MAGDIAKVIGKDGTMDAAVDPNVKTVVNLMNQISNNPENGLYDFLAQQIFLDFISLSCAGYHG